MYPPSVTGSFNLHLKKRSGVMKCLSYNPLLPPSDNLFELLLMIDAAKRASATRPLMQ